MVHNIKYVLYFTKNHDFISLL